eukprot:scaffold120_cov59-Cylindrotheca_fusiformis.AAC.13
MSPPSKPSPTPNEMQKNKNFPLLPEAVFQVSKSQAQGESSHATGGRDDETIPETILTPNKEASVASSTVELSKHEVDPEYTGQYVGPVTPRSNDVLFGKGYKKHPGNTVLREVMDAQEKEYEGATKRHKMELTCVIVQSMIWSGARFCVQEDGKWYQVKYIQAHRKVSKALRNRRRSK